MSEGFVGPYTLEYDIFVDNLKHTLTANVDTSGSPTPGDDPADVLLRVRSGGTLELNTVADSFWDSVRPFYATASLCSTYALYKREVGTGAKQFISGGSLTTPNGSNANPYTPAGQVTMTFRPAAGGVGKFVFIETGLTGNQRVPLTSTGVAVVTAFAAYIVSEDSPALARNRSYLVAPMNYSAGQNEKTFNRRFRS